ncbi:MAG: alpha/beta fold hydrolase, partial [Limisphaerales bacterium]
MEEETKIQMRTDGESSLPTLIYLPGIHGDWTLLTGFRELAKKKFFLVQFIYPRTLSWSLEDYARAVSKALAEAGITGGWVLAESYSSQVAWTWLKIADEGPLPFRFDGIVLAGGFVRYPAPIALRAVQAFFAVAPWRLWKVLFWVYQQFSGFRHRNSPGAACSGQEFVERRTPLDIEAIRARLRLIAGCDPRPVAAKARCPVYVLAGTIDPVVLVWPVLRWLRRHCPTFNGHRIIWPADHNVL